LEKSEIAETTEVTQKEARIPVRGAFKVWRGGNLKNCVRKWSGLVLITAPV
jgi:RNA polymerase subunit RPABC4/transcription elongation factor Spt4